MPTPIDPAVARVRFGRFVDRALANARAAGLSDRTIAQKSSVSTSTFHRWRLGRSLPSMKNLRAFCEVTGASVQDAMSALGMTDEPATATPEPPLPRAVVIILRKLADPTTPEAEREFINMTLQMLAERRTPRSNGGVAEAS